jgi:hypothetical protein
VVPPGLAVITYRLNLHNTGITVDPGLLPASAAMV